MNALDLGQLNIRPNTEYVVYCNELSATVTVTLALTDIQTPFEVQFGATMKTLGRSGAITVAVPGETSLRISHGDPKIMQPVRVQMLVELID